MAWLFIALASAEVEARREAHRQQIQEVGKIA
jgi:hypothetical protein